MVQRLAETLPAIFHTDETAWLEQTAMLVRQGLWEEIDTVNLAEYLCDMAKRDLRETESRLIVLLMHLLKWEYQPMGRCASWAATIWEQQRQLRDLLASGTLHNHAGQILSLTYTDARKQAALETGLEKSAFPAVCPWTLETMLIDPVAE
jgi:hypothetical protein